MAEQSSDPLRRPLADGIVPAEVIARTEKRWLMMAIVVVTGIVGALQPSSNVEVVDRTICPPNGPDAEAIKEIVSPVTTFTRPIPSNHLSQEVCLCSRVSKSRAA